NYNATQGDWDLLLIRGNSHDDGSGHISYIDQAFIGDAENTKYPAVDVNDNNVIILAQTDEAGTQDIVCYYSSDAGVTWEKSYVANGTNDELYPKIVTYGDTATCTFIMNDDIYYAQTDDGGATWGTPEKVNDETGSVASEYRNTDITTDGTVVWTDMRNGNADIYLDNVAGAPAFPIITLGNFTGGLGKVSIPVKNIGDADATNVNVTVTVVGGILGRINKTKTQVIPTLAMNQEVTVTTDGFIFGLGKVQLTATARCPEAVPPIVTKTATGKVLVVFITGIA
ncbi:MAG: exo-alpha-sialidase, partial [Thermoplasmata archaeon]|nr:exo-alpha-sialidase [Thermoplasmata archaeon]